MRRRGLAARLALCAAWACALSPCCEILRQQQGGGGGCMLRLNELLFFKGVGEGGGSCC